MAARPQWACLILAVVLGVDPLAAQEAGTVRGSVTLIENAAGVHGAVVLVVGPGLVALTDERGGFQIDGVPAGTYEVLAQREHLSAGRQTITLVGGGSVTLRFELGLSPVHEEVTVTASPSGTETTFEAFNAITTLDSFDLATNIEGTIGEVLEHEAGVAKRSFGPGTSRPIIRGFDGDRVLVMQDGIRTGDLSSQSGDHGVSIDPASLERLEIVRGPATLLYGSNAIGGVVNAITPHETFLNSATDGLRGQVTSDTGSANAQAAGNASLQFGRERWMLWGGGGARRTEDYDAPDGPVDNSATRLANGRVGAGYAGETLFFSAGVQIEDGRYGVPFAGQLGALLGESESRGAGRENPPPRIDLEHRRYGTRFDVGARNLDNPAIDAVRVAVSYLDWHHEEIEDMQGRPDVIGTTYDNESIVTRVEIDQQPRGPLSGKMGVWTLHRDYRSLGEEALSPPTTQQAFAAFGYEELDYGRYRIQLGGRVEANGYRVGPRAGAGAVGGAPATPPVRDRDFIGTSGSVGVQVDLGATGTMVANLTRSYRAPALEELYNFGPHVGNLSFEIGNPDLERESSLGFDLSVRHRSGRARGEVNAYVYRITDFVFPALRGDVVDGLRVAEFLQGDSRFLGVDADGSVRIVEQVWLNIGLGFVDAKLTATDEALPRIPPFQGRVSVNIPYRGFTVRPEWIWAADQARVFRGETTTTGYSVLNVGASYVWPRAHAAHIFSVRGYNLTNALYRNHTSFIKDLAPEIGRGIKATYSMRFF